jgi:hypothetical protein
MLLVYSLRFRFLDLGRTLLLSIINLVLRILRVLIDKLPPDQ